MSKILERIDERIPDAIIDLRYATENNITHKQLYASDTAALRPQVLTSLADAADSLREHGYCVVVWDAYRPPKVQKELLAVCDDSDYVAQVSNHCRGITLDITLADMNGTLLDMGTDHDEFSPMAHAGSSLITPKQAANRALLKDALENVGFKQLPTEWWHFDYVNGKDEPVLSIGLEEI